MRDFKEITNVAPGDIQGLIAKKAKQIKKSLEAEEKTKRLYGQMLDVYDEIVTITAKATGKTKKQVYAALAEPDDEG